MSSLFYRRVLQIGVALAFVMPLVVGLDNFIFPFVVPKILYFRVLVTVLAMVFALYLAVHWRDARPYKSWLLGVVIVYFAAMTISTLLSVDVHRSVWDNHERMLGLYTMIHYLVLYFIARQVFRTWKEWRLLFMWAILLAIPIFVIAVYQLFGDDTFLLNQRSARVRSTLGNTIYLSAYGLFIVALSVILFVKEKVNWVRALWVGSGLFAVVVIIMTQTRGTWLGLGVAGLIFLAGLSLNKKTIPWIKKSSIAVLVLGFIFVGAVFAMKDKPVVQQNKYLNRITQISFTQGSGRTRALAWQTAIKASKDHLAFGWGPANFFYAFNAHYNPEFMTYGAQETWFDNAHNVLLNHLAELGIVGLLAFLIVYGFAFGMTWRITKHDEDMWLVAHALRAFIVGHFIHNLVVFENASSLMYMFVLFAFLDVFSRKPLETVSQRGSSKGISLAIAGVAVLIIGFIGARGNLPTLKGNNAMKFAFAFIQRGDVANSYKWYEEAKTHNSPHQDDIVRDYSNQIRSIVNTNNREVMKQYHDIVYPVLFEDLQRQIDESPVEIRLMLTMTELHFHSGLYRADAKSFLTAVDWLNSAEKLSPNRQQILWQLGQLYLLLDDKEKGVAVLERAISVNEDVPEAYWRIALLYSGLEDFEPAGEYYRLAIEHGFDDRKNQSVIAAAVDTLKTIGDVETQAAYEELLYR